MMIGHVDFCSHVVVSGWALDPGHAGPAEIEVYADDELVGQALANRFRADLRKHRIGGGKAGFEVALSLPLSSKPIEMSVRLKSSGQELQGSPQVLAPALLKSPDEYQEDVRRWLDKRFGVGGWEDGIYKAHQPIYGFRAGFCEPDWPVRYLITYNIMHRLARLNFSSLVDVGGAEGYKGALAKQLFGCDVLSCDLSIEACRRAEELYGLTTQQVDIHTLPFESESHDIVLASETIEHVIDYRQAITELLRVARKAVVITVPHEALQDVAETIRRGDIHGHIHHFDTHTFDYLKDQVEVLSERIVSFSPFIRKPSVWMECRTDQWEGVPSRSEQIWLTIREAIFGPRVTAACLALDSWLLQVHPRAGYAGVLCTLVKDSSVLRAQPSRSLSIKDVMSFQVPFCRQKP